MITYLERADLLVLVCDVSCVFVTFSYGVLDKVWYFIVSISDLCLLSYFSYSSIKANAVFVYLRFCVPSVVT